MKRWKAMSNWSKAMIILCGLLLPEIDLEKARRNNLVAEENAKVFEESKEAYELKRLELLKDMLGDSDKVYFIPEGTDITLFLGGESALPLQQ